MTNKEMIKANARIKELEAENKDLLDELEVVNQKKISNWLKVKELEYEIDKLSANMTSMFHQDRANRLAVVADALASECKKHEDLEKRFTATQNAYYRTWMCLEAREIELFVYKNASFRQRIKYLFRGKL